MGKRKKSSRGPTKRVRQTLDTTFSCLFCNHDRSVICSMDKKGGVGNLSCKVCGQTFQAPINALSAPVDVYSDWVDACEAVQTKPPPSSGSGAPASSRDSAAAGEDVERDEEDRLSDLDEDEFD